MLVDDTWSTLALEHGVTFSSRRVPGDAPTDVVLEVPGWPAPVAYQVKVTPQALTPSMVARWNDAARRLGAQLLVVCGDASARALDAARTAEVSVIVAPHDGKEPVRGLLIDPSGGTFAIEPPVEDQVPRRRARGRVPWGTYAIALELLASYPHIPTQTDLAEHLGLTQGRVSQALGQLRSTLPQGFDPRRALSQWLRENYPPPVRAATTWMTLESPVDTAMSASALLDDRGIRHAVSGQVAADWLAPWARPEVALVWTEAATDLTPAGATPVVRADANLILAVPADPHLLRRLHTVQDRPPVLAPWRVWLDLITTGGDTQSADILAERLLSGVVAS